MSYLIPAELLSHVVGGCDKHTGEHREISPADQRRAVEQRCAKEENHAVEQRNVEQRSVQDRGVEKY
ncbi:MAG: hypothetical protein V4490_02280 [Pseudomonadota bacterium]